jgi:hypothetical protein
MGVIDCKVVMDSVARYGWFGLQGRDGFSCQAWMVLTTREMDYVARYGW